MATGSGDRGAAQAGGLVWFARVVCVGAVAALILVSGAWGSWHDAQYVVFGKGHEHGTVRLVACGDTDCTGPFSPKGAARARARVTVALPVRHHVGDSVGVVLKPGAATGVRDGLGGLLFAFLPLAGALLLAAVLVALGLRMPRTAWTMAVAGAALMGGAFLTL